MLYRSSMSSTNSSGTSQCLITLHSPSYHPLSKACLYRYTIKLFIYSISIAPLQVTFYSEALPAKRVHCVEVFTPKRTKQLLVKDLLKVPTWCLGRGSNPRRSGRRQMTVPTVPPRLTNIQKLIIIQCSILFNVFGR